MITELNNPDTSTKELKADLAPLRAMVNKLKGERDFFLQSKEMDANVERIRREIRMESIQERIDSINEVLLYRSKTTES